MSHACQMLVSSLVSGDNLANGETATNDHDIVDDVAELLSNSQGNYARVHVVEGMEGRRGLAGKAEYSVDYTKRGHRSLNRQRGVLYNGLLVTDARGETHQQHPEYHTLYHSQVLVYRYTGPLPLHLEERKAGRGVSHPAGTHEALGIDNGPSTHNSSHDGSSPIVATFRHKRLIISEIQDRIREIRRERKKTIR